MYQPIMARPSVLTKNSALGTMKAQGCSGDGTVLSCLFTADNVTGTGRGTLKLLDARTLQPIWGTADSADSYDLDPATSAGGQVPIMFSSGRIAAGDAMVHVLYDSSGAAVTTMMLGGNGVNFGLTLISDTRGIVSQADGVLTLVDVSTWQNLGTLILRDPNTGERVLLASPSSATDNALYAIATNPRSGRGFLYSVGIDPGIDGLAVRSIFTYTGNSGASPVVVIPAQSGLSSNLILLHVPGLIADSTPQNRLLGLLDTGSGLMALWSITLSQALSVAPTVDEVSESLFFQYRGPELFQYDLISGTPMNVFNIQAQGNFPSNFTLNGHLGSIQRGNTFKVLLSGSVPSGSSGAGQYVMAFAPIASPTSLLWKRKIDSRPHKYTAAWNLGPSKRAGVFCPIVVGVAINATTLARVCDI